jgi:hypothetical protein
MRLFIDVDTNSFITDSGFKAPVTAVSFKRGDASQIELTFVSGNSPLSATNDKLISFGIKETGKYDADFVVAASEYTTSNYSYILNPSFNTASLDDLLMSGDFNALNDIGSISTMMEITWSIDAGATWYSSNTITATIANDVIKGLEGSPVENQTVIEWIENQDFGFAKLNGGNDFSGNQTVQGALTAISFTLSGSDFGLRKIGSNPSSAGITNHSSSGASNDMFVFGRGAGQSATNASNSNFLGWGAGNSATNASNSNFMGYGAGFGSTEANHSNFFGSSTGEAAVNADHSNFIGPNAGNGATNANDSNFIGDSAGDSAENADNSNFLGKNAGNGASSASHSFFVGNSTGQYVTGSHNNIIGQGSTLNPLSLSGCLVIGKTATATQNNTIALGSTTTPFLTSGSGTTTGKYLVVRLNGQDLKIPLYS